MQARDYISGETFTLEKAPEGWWVTVPVPTAWDRYYPPLYYGVGKRRRFPWPVEWLQNRLYGARVRLVTRLVPGRGRVLDVGCGPGHLLARFRAAGWDPTGTEATEASADLARGQHGLAVLAGDLEQLALPSAAYDAVVSWHSLEHMRQPGLVLDEMARVLKPGGILLVSVPNFGSDEAQARPAAWFHLDVPRHLVHFPAEALRRALEQRGFRIEAENYRAPEYDTFSQVQTWQNRLGLPHNTLYLVLKSVRRTPGVDPTAGQRIGALLLAALMAAPALAVSSWRAAKRKGAVVVFAARKTPNEIASNRAAGKADAVQSCMV